jgi:hypothetical protein
MSPGGYTRAHLEVGIMWVWMDVGMDGWMFAQFSNVNEPSNEARLAAESCTASHVYTEYLVLFSSAKIILMTHSVSTCLAGLVAHSG